MLNLSSMQQALSNAGPAEPGFQRTNSDALSLKNRINSFRGMENWRRQGNHVLTGTQQARREREMGDIAGQYAGLTGSQAMPESPPAAAPTVAQAPAAAPTVAQVLAAQPVVNPNRQPDIMSSTAPATKSTNDMYAELGLKSPVPGLAGGGQISGPPGDDQVPAAMPNGDPARLQDGEYVLPAAVVDALGGPQSLDKLVASITGKEPGPTAKTPLEGQMPPGPAEAYKCGGKVKAYADGGEMEEDKRKPVMTGRGQQTESGKASVERLTPTAAGLASLARYTPFGGLVPDMRQAQKPAQTPPLVRQETVPAQAPAPAPAPAPKETAPEAPAINFSQSSPTQIIRQRIGAEGEPEFYRARRSGALAAPARSYGPTDHERTMAGIEGKAALAATRKLAAMAQNERGRATADQIIGTQSRDAYNQAQRRGMAVDAALEAKRIEKGPKAADVVKAAEVQRKIAKDTGIPAANTYIDKQFELNPNPAHAAKAKEFAGRLMQVPGMNGGLAGSIAMQATSEWPAIVEEIASETEGSKLPSDKLQSLISRLYEDKTQALWNKLYAQYPQLRQVTAPQ